MMLVDYEKVFDGDLGVKYRRGVVSAISGSFIFVRLGAGGATIKAHVSSGVEEVRRGDFVVVYYNPPEQPIITANITKANWVSFDSLLKPIVDRSVPDRASRSRESGIYTIDSSRDELTATEFDSIVYAPATAKPGELAAFDELDERGRRIRSTSIRYDDVLTNNGLVKGAIEAMQEFVNGIIANTLRIFKDAERNALVILSNDVIEMQTPKDIHLISDGASIEARQVLDLAGNLASSFRRTGSHGIYQYEDQGKNYTLYRADEHVWEGNTLAHIGIGSTGARNFDDADIYLPQTYRVYLGATGELRELVVKHDVPNIAWAEVIVKPGNMERMESIVYQSLIAFKAGHIVFRFEFRESKDEVTVDGKPPYLDVKVRLIREPTQ